MSFFLLCFCVFPCDYSFTQLVRKDWITEASFLLVCLSISGGLPPHPPNSMTVFATLDSSLTQIICIFRVVATILEKVSMCESMSTNVADNHSIAHCLLWDCTEYFNFCGEILYYGVNIIEKCIYSVTGDEPVYIYIRFCWVYGSKCY